MDDLLPPMTEKDSPIPTFRRKSPERAKSFTNGPAETIHMGSPTRSVSIIPTQSPERKKEGEMQGKEEIDIWTTALDSKPTISTCNPKSKDHKGSDEVRKQIPITDAGKTTKGELPPDLASAVLEIQTVLRRDVERLRLDMVRQFISFRSEMGQKWEGEVDRLRQENQSLKEELDTLKKENEKKRDSMGRWKLR